MRTGGKDIARCVRKMMESAITHKAASKFTILGQKKARGKFSGPHCAAL